MSTAESTQSYTLTPDEFAIYSYCNKQSEILEKSEILKDDYIFHSKKSELIVAHERMELLVQISLLQQLCLDILDKKHLN